MTTFTILVPTHNHSDTLWYSVESILQQSLQDFEIFIVGDGVPQRTREIVAAMSDRDPRIRFFDNLKGDRHGEAHRHAALQYAQGRFVCYQCDDDLWFPDHLALLAEKLEDHDLAHSMAIEITPEGGLISGMFDARLSPTDLKLMRMSEKGFGLASGGHTLDAYRRLPRGWHPAPAGIPTDKFFWLQFLEQPWCRYASIKWPTLCHFSSVARKKFTHKQRVAELAIWWPKVADVQEHYRMVREVLLPLHDKHFHGASMWRPLFHKVCSFLGISMKTSLIRRLRVGLFGSTKSVLATRDQHRYSSPELDKPCR